MLLVALFVDFVFCGLRFHEESMKLHEALKKKKGYVNTDFGQIRTFSMEIEDSNSNVQHEKDSVSGGMTGEYEKTFSYSYAHNC